MEWITKIFSKSAIKEVGNVVDALATSEDEKLEAKQALSDIVLDHLESLAASQKEVLVTELSGTKLQRNWRPIVMLVFTLIIVYAKFISPLFGLQGVELEGDFWALLKLGLGGYVVGRTGEKIAQTLTKNIDLPFIKKRNRKIDSHEQED